MSAIEVKNLVKKFHGQTVLHGIDLEVKPGEVVAIIGPSGSGKTTLLRSINLLEQPEAGTITVGDITIDTARSLSQQKSLIRQFASARRGLSSRTLICFRIVRCWKTLLKGR
ncbi:putative cystine ABC-transporter, ATP-binding protein [Escherichia coli]|uniref:Putative cystine ABC-transporter, ATP-binding protein n=1 Tax=Escherichia coli TaxID=562 RepID=A0A376VIY0_ECOLX|nr:putative cystine ABC-transporter, ATP-binding protein [Escherichia coli]